jgi:hypothetical protein
VVECLPFKEKVLVQVQVPSKTKTTKIYYISIIKELKTKQTKKETKI